MNRPATAPHDTAAARKKLIIALDFERRREAEASLASAQAAKFAAGARRLPLLGVTVLTSYNDKDLAEAGYAYGVADLVARHAAQARACAHEVCAMRARCAGYTAGGSGSWQKRTMTPGVPPARRARSWCVLPLTWSFPCGLQGL
jgi:orotidine-5'-phosphate decarboxylase